MKIVAITYDQMIAIDGVPAMMRDIGGFHMKRGEWAVHFDTDTGIGSIEFTDNRLNETITSETFHQSYAWLIDEHQRYQDYVKDQSA